MILNSFIHVCIYSKIFFWFLLWCKCPSIEIEMWVQMHSVPLGSWQCCVKKNVQLREWLWLWDITQDSLRKWFQRWDLKDQKMLTLKWKVGRLLLSIKWISYPKTLKGWYLVSTGVIGKIHSTGAERPRRRTILDEVRKVSRGQVTWDFIGHIKRFLFFLTIW